MKKRMRRLTVLLLAAATLLVCAATAFAAGTVTYDGNAREFIFAPGSEYSTTDLFTDFKGLMPGDSATQAITINNAADKKIKIKVYMRSLGAQEGSEELLSHMNLTVRQNGNSVLFEAPANETAQLTDWVYLGTVYSGGKIDLDVTVNVDPALDNRFQDAIGYLDWQFRVEELPVSPEDPKTGDAFDPMLWVLAAAGSLAMIAVLVAVFKRKAKADGGTA